MKVSEIEHVNASNIVLKQLPQPRGSPSKGCPEKAGGCPPTVQWGGLPSHSRLQ